MTVRELASKLERLDPDMEVYCHTEDEALLSSKHIARLLDISEITITHATPMRSKDQIAGLTFGKGEHSKEYAILEVTGDF